MYYLGHFVFISPDKGDRSFGYFTCLTEADSTEQAVDKFEDQVTAIAESSELFDEVQTIYLEDIIEFETLSDTAVLTRFEMFAGERPPSANITLPEQTGADAVSFYRPVSENEELDEVVLVPFIEFEE